MPALFDFSSRAKLRLTGSDRVRFLNGQVTNDVRKATPRLTIAACVVSAKGKMDALIGILPNDDSLLIETEAELRETLAQRLERYLIADDVTVEDVTDEFALFHALGDAPPALPNEFTWRSSRRFGGGWDLLVPSAQRENARQMLAAGAEFYAAEAAERFRIERGVPRWGRELTPEIIPVEANLENETIDYAKGCYIGQEVISRMRMSGQTNKRLRGLVSLGGEPLAAGMQLLDAGTAKDAGWTTSAARSESLGKAIALGFARRGFSEPGTRLDAKLPNESSESITVEVAALPFR